MTEVTISLPKVFEPFLEPHRYKGAWGGRGSGKSMAMAILLVLRAASQEGFRAVCIREVQRTLKESSKRLIEDTIQRLELGHLFEVQHDQIKTPGDGVILFVGMQDANAENIKSLEGMDVAFVEEAQTLSHRSLELLRPTIRKANSELWFAWNPRRKQDAIEGLLKGPNPPSDAVVLKVNWKDNPFFPEVLEQERQDCLRNSPEGYGHIWEGEYMKILSGAYYAKQIHEAQSDGRISKVPRDPLLPLRVSFDIGGTGAKSDAVAIWGFQVVGKEIRILHYYEARGQELGEHIGWMRSKGYRPENTIVHLPHDGKQNDKVYAVSYQSAIQDAGYTVEIFENPGVGAVAARIECTRRMFPSCWFNADTTQGGIEALSWYHSKVDEVRGIDLGADHDWSSHGADSFGLLCLVAEGLQKISSWGTDLDYTSMDRSSAFRK